MTDTPNTKSAIMTAFADNTAGAITPQVLRNGFETLFDRTAISVMEYGAKGDGVTDDSTAFQNAINAANALAQSTGIGNVGYQSAVSVVVPATTGKVFRVGGVEVPDHVVIVGSSASSHGSANIKGIGTAAFMFRFGNTAAADRSGIIGCTLEVGGSMVRCLDFVSGGGNIVAECSILSFPREAVRTGSSCIAGTFRDIFSMNCLSDKANITVMSGVFDLDGHDHWCSRVELGVQWAGSAFHANGKITSSNLYCNAWIIRGTMNFFEGCLGEISDAGWYVLGDRNRFVNCRADRNWGHGWRILGGYNSFASCHSPFNSVDTTGTYDGFRCEGTSAGENTFVGCVVSNSGGTSAHRYSFFVNGVRFGGTGGAELLSNVFIGCLGSGAVTKQYFQQWDGGNGFIRSMVVNRGYGGNYTMSGATPDIGIADLWTTGNSGATTVTNFINGYHGQRLIVVGGDANTTIANNGNIVTQSGANLTVANGKAYEFVNYGDVWHQL